MLSGRYGFDLILKAFVAQQKTRVAAEKGLKDRQRLDNAGLGGDGSDVVTLGVTEWVEPRKAQRTRNDYRAGGYGWKVCGMGRLGMGNTNLR